MPRILLLIVLIWVLYVVIKRFIANAQSTRAPSNSNVQSEKFVICSQCHCHIPESDTRIRDNVVYCSNPECDAQRK